MDSKPEDRYLPVLLWALGILLAVFSTALFMLRGESNETRRKLHNLDMRQQIHELQHQYERNDQPHVAGEDSYD